MTPEELKKQRADEAVKKEQEAQAQLNQQKLQMQEALGEMLTPVTTALADLQGKYQALQKSQLQAGKPDKSREQQMDDLLGELNDDDKYDKLSNKQMLDVISTSLDNALKANTESVRQSIAEDMKPAMDKVGTLEKATMQIIAGMGVKDARSKHKDFDEHLPEIKEVLNKYPGMDYSDAYLLAKSQKAGAVPPRGQIDTEKPQSTGAVPSGQPDPTPLTGDNMAIIAQRGRDARSGGQQKTGRAGFMELAEASADKILSAKE